MDTLRKDLEQPQATDWLTLIRYATHYVYQVQFDLPKDIFEDKHHIQQNITYARWQLACEHAFA